MQWADSNKRKYYINKESFISVQENKGWLSFFSLDSIKDYFDVTNSYVLHKLRIIVFPVTLKVYFNLFIDY